MEEEGCGLSHAVPRTSRPVGQAWLNQGLPTSGVLTLPDAQSLFFPTLRGGNEGCGVGTQEGSLPPEAPKNAFQPGPSWERTPCPTLPRQMCQLFILIFTGDFPTAATAFSLRGWSALTTPSSGLPLHWFYCSDLNLQRPLQYCRLAPSPSFWFPHRPLAPHPSF